MSHGDEKIIAQRLAKQKEQLHTIDNTVYINKTEYTFARREFEYGFSMVVPESFDDMPSDIADQKFPHRNRPPVIISSVDYRVFIAFHHDEPSNKSISDRIKNYRAYMKKRHPTNVFFTQGIYDIQNGQAVGYYDYRYEVVDSSIYCVNFIADLPDRELFGWFACQTDVKEDWEPLARQMIRSIQLTGGE